MEGRDRVRDGAEEVFEPLVDVTDMIFSNQEITDVFTALLEESAPAAGVDDETAEAVTEMLDGADTTQEAVEAINDALEPGFVLDQIDAAIPDDDIAGQFFGVFREGVENSGLFRNGSRENRRRRR